MDFKIFLYKILFLIFSLLGLFVSIILGNLLKIQSPVVFLLVMFGSVTITTSSFFLLWNKFIISKKKL